jgi:hypothetical protein
MIFCSSSKDPRGQLQWTWLKCCLLALELSKAGVDIDFSGRLNTKIFDNVFSSFNNNKAFKSDAEGQLFTKFRLWRRHGGCGRRWSAPRIFTITTNNKSSIFF